MSFSIETEEDNTKRFIFNDPADGNDKHNNIRATTRGLVQDCQGNDNPNAQPEVLVACSDLDSRIPPHLMDFRFVDAIQSQYKVGPWQSASAAMAIAGADRYKLVEWAYSPSSAHNPGAGEEEVWDSEALSYGQGPNTLLVVVVHFSCPVFVAGHTNYQYEGSPNLPNHNVVPASGTPYLTLTRNVPGEAQDTEILTYQDMSLQTNYDSTDRTLVKGVEDGVVYFSGPDYYGLSNRQYFNQYLYKNGSHSMAFVSKSGPTSPFPLMGYRKTGTTYSVPVNALSLNGGTITEGTSAGGANVIITNDAARGALGYSSLELSSEYYIDNPNHYNLWVNF